MYAIMSNGVMLALCDQPHYVKKNEKGVYVQTQPPNAEAIAVNGTLYNLPGQTAVPKAPEAVAVEIESGELIAQNVANIQAVSDTSAIAFIVMAEAGNIDAATAGEHAEIFAEWAAPVDYQAGNIRRYGSKLYRCIQAHTSQGDWTPNAAPSLWSAIADPAEEWPAWSAPIGAHDAYPAGAQVSHKDKHWTSDTDNNIWEPGIYGWMEVS